MGDLSPRLIVVFIFPEALSALLRDFSVQSVQYSHSSNTARPYGCGTEEWQNGRVIIIIMIIMIIIYK